MYSDLPPAGLYHPAGDSTYATPILSFCSFTYVIRTIRLLRPSSDVRTVNCTCNVSQTPKKADLMRLPHLPGLENAWGPRSRYPEPRIVVRDPSFCVAAHLSSKRTASEQSDSNPLKLSAVECMDKPEMRLRLLCYGIITLLLSHNESLYHVSLELGTHIFWRCSSMDHGSSCTCE